MLLGVKPLVVAGEGDTKRGAINPGIQGSLVWQQPNTQASSIRHYEAISSGVQTDGRGKSLTCDSLLGMKFCDWLVMSALGRGTECSGYVCK